MTNIMGFFRKDGADVPDFPAPPNDDWEKVLPFLLGKS
jgi:hypothetical protein